MEAAGEAGDDKSPSKTEPDDQGSRQLSVDQLRTLSIDKVTVEKIVLESSAGSREVLLTKNESSRRVSIKSEVEKPASGDNYRSSLPDDIKAFDGRRSKKPERIKPIRLTKSPSIGSLAVATGVPVDEAKGEDKENLLITEEEDKENLLIAKEEKVNARNLLERSQTNIEVLQRNLNTRIGASTAQRYKKKLLESRENRRPKFAGRIAFDEEFLQKHNLDKRLKIEEYGLPNLPPQPEEEEEGSSKAGYSEKVLEVEKRWSGEFLKNQLDRRSSESSKSSYVGEYGSVSSRESIAEDYDPRAASSAVLFQSGKEKFEAGRPISLNCAKTLAASTLSTLDSDSCLEDRIKSLEEDIEEDGDSVARRRIGRSSDPWRESMLPFEFWNRKETTESRIDETRNSRVSLLESTRVDGYASLIRKFTMEAGSSRSRKEEKQKRKLGFRRLLPGFFSPKDSRKDYKKKEGKERKRAGDDRHFARYQQNGNYARSADTMNLNEDIKRNVKLDNSLNGSMIEERLDEIKRELFPLDQGPITSTPDHLAREDQGGGGQLPARSYTTDSSLSSIAPDERWAGERSGQLLGVSPDARKFEQRQRQRYGQPLERKHSLQEPNHCAPRQQPAFFQRNHGPSGRISAPPAERYLARPRPVDRPLPAIPRSRLDLLSNYENYLEAGEQALYENENPPPGLILKSVSAQVKITRQPIVNQNQRAPLLGRSPKYLSSGSSQKSGDYGGESSCTPNSSQKSEFSPTSSKSGEYYLHSPRDTGSPNEEDSRRDEGIYENEKSPDERIYDETPCEEADSNLVEDKRGSPRRSRSRGGERAASPARGSAEKLCGEQGKAISPMGSRRPPSARRAQPNEQILIASPKRDVPYETRIPRPCNESRRCLVESPVHMTNAPRKLVVANSGQDSSDASKGQVSLEIPRPEPVYARQRNPEPASPEKKTNSQERKEGEERVAWVQASSSPQIGEAGSQKVDRSIEDHRQNSIPTMEPQPLQRNPNLEEQRVSNQLDSRQRSLEDGAQYNQRTYEATQRMGPLSPSKQETRQHLEAFYWQQKALEAHRKSLASPASEKQMGRKIDLPEVREAVYWQQLKKLDEEQQRRIYEQNPMDESSYCKAKRVSAPRQQGPPVRVAATGGLPLPVIAHHGNPSSWTCGNAKPSPGGKPPLMQSQKGQNQPVLIVRPQQAIRDPRVDAKPLDSVQRSKSASPHFHRGDVPQARKLELSSSIYEEEATNDVEGKAVAHPPPPPPIFKRGSLIGGESVEYGSGSGAKRVSFSNQSGVGGQELASGSWPTKHGTAPEPPTRRHRSEDSVSDTDSVFSYPDRLRDPSCEYDADRPLPPLPKDATRRGVAYNGDTTRCNVGVDPRRGVSPQRVLRQKGEYRYFFSFLSSGENSICREFYLILGTWRDMVKDRACITSYLFLVAAT